MGEGWLVWHFQTLDITIFYTFIYIKDKFFYIELTFLVYLYVPGPVLGALHVFSPLGLIPTL